MPIFKVRMQVDAWVNYVALIEADDPEDAANTAYDGLVEIEWKQIDVDEFDARTVVTLDQDDEEMDHTRRGRF